MGAQFEKDVSDEEAVNAMFLEESVTVANAMRTPLFTSEELKRNPENVEKVYITSYHLM